MLMPPDPSDTPESLSDVAQALFLLLGGVVLSIVAGATLLLARRWSVGRRPGVSGPTPDVDPWSESAKRIGGIEDGDSE